MSEKIRIHSREKAPEEEHVSQYITADGARTMLPPAFEMVTSGTPPIQKKSEEEDEDEGWGWMDWVHTGLDVVGLIPGVGEIADLANAALYAGEGDYGNASLSAAAAIPFVGWGATAGKLAKHGVDAAQAIDKSNDVRKVADNATAVSKTGDKVIAPAKETKLSSKSNGRGGKQARLREMMNDPKVSSADRGWLKNDQRHIKFGNKKGLRVPRNGRKSPGRKAKDKGYELAHPHDSPASQGNDYAGAKLKNHADHKVETRLHSKRY